MQLHNIVETVTLLLGIGVAGFGFLQYRESQRWKVSEFVAAEMRQLLDDSGNRAVLKMLDWSNGTVVVDDLHGNGRPLSFKFGRTLVISSLAVDRVVESSDPPPDGAAASPSNRYFDRDEELVRGLFDEFFADLERLNSYIDVENRLFEAAKLKPYLGYYLRIINRDDPLGGALRRFVETYGYTGTQNLVAEVSGMPWHVG